MSSLQFDAKEGSKEVETFFNEKLRSETEDHTIPRDNNAAIDLEGDQISLGRSESKYVPLENEAKLYKKLQDDNVVIYHRVNDPIYDEFRSHVKLRDQFNSHLSEIELNDRVKIWRTHRNIEQDTKDRLAKYDKAQKAKQNRLRNILTCKYCRKKPETKEKKQLDWLKTRNKRIQTQRRNADENYMYMD